MTWITDNWVGILIAVAFVGMHLFGHRGHGGHGGRSEPRTVPDTPDAAAAELPPAKPPASGGHTH